MRKLARDKILEALVGEGRPLRWSELLNLTGLSPRALSNELRKLQKDGEVDSYPATDEKQRLGRYYKLREEASETSNVKIMMYSLLYFRYEDDLKFDRRTSDVRFLQELGEHIAAYCLYSLIMHLQNPKTDWFTKALDALYMQSMPIAMAGRALHQSTIGRRLKKAEIGRKGGQPTVLFELPPIPKNRIKELKAALVKLYPRQAELFFEHLGQKDIFTLWQRMWSEEAHAS